MCDVDVECGAAAGVTHPEVAGPAVQQGECSMPRAWRRWEYAVSALQSPATHSWVCPLQLPCFARVTLFIKLARCDSQLAAVLLYTSAWCGCFRCCLLQDAANQHCQHAMHLLFAKGAGAAGLSATAAAVLLCSGVVTTLSAAQLDCCTRTCCAMSDILVAAGSASTTMVLGSAARLLACNNLPRISSRAGASVCGTPTG